MSRSPREGEAPAGLDELESDPYLNGWRAINRLIRQGYSWSGRERNSTFQNLGGGRFVDVSFVSGLDAEDDGRAAVRIDWDFDGDLDLLVTNRTGPRVKLMINEANDRGHFLAVRLESSGTTAVGARVEVHVSGDGPRTFVATHRAGEGYLAQQSSWLHFGLGDRSPERVVVRWPDGAVEEFADAPVDAQVILTRGSGTARVFEPPRQRKLAASNPGAPRSTARARVVLATPVPMPRLEVESIDGRRNVLFGVRPGEQEADSSRPVLLNLWASWCAPCVSELRDFQRSADELAFAGVDLLALGVERGDQRAAAEAALTAIGWSSAAVYGTEHAIEILDALHGALLDHDRRIPVPASFLIDGQGRLVAFYLGAVGAERLTADLALLEMDEEERRDAAVPFPGRWANPPEEAGLGYLEARFRARGLWTTAAEYHHGGFEVHESSRAAVLHQFGQVRARQDRMDEAIAQFRAALEVDPYFFDAHRDLGVAFYVQRKLAPAIAAYRRALLIDPTDEDTHYNLGIALLAAGDREGALEEVRMLRSMGSEAAAALLGEIEPAGD